jgi:glutamate/tyrosine decarboxylase-like PLP-dependent enzyme
MFFCRHRDSVAQAFRSDVTYMPGKTAGQIGDAAVTFDPLTHSVQWSRRFIGLKLFMSLAERGEAGYAAMIEHQARMGNLLRELLAASGWRIVNSTPLPVVCFTRDGLAPTPLLAAMRERQIAWMSETNLGGVPVMRACVTSFRTTEKDIEQVVDEMNRLVDDWAHRKTA